MAGGELHGYALDQIIEWSSTRNYENKIGNAKKKAMLTEVEKLGNRRRHRIWSTIYN